MRGLCCRPVNPIPNAWMAMDGVFAMAQLERLTVKEPFDRHGLISDGIRRRLKVGDIAL